MVVPDGDAPTRSYRLGGSAYRFLRVGGTVLGVIVVLMLASWGFLAVRAYEAAQLESQVEMLLAREEQVHDLAALLDEMEAEYRRLRDMFGADALPTGDPWIPPATGGGASGDGGVTDDGLPTSWPLTERGFVTQALLEGAGADHPGIDVAVPAGSYIRAAGRGTVVEAGEDAVYGRYLVLEHQDGYRSLYAHASLLLADEGDVVRRNEVIALTGSTGRSTAPHLHFELLRDGEPVDPLLMLTQP